MLAEAAHSAADTLNQVFLLTSLRQADRRLTLTTSSGTARNDTSGRCWRRSASSSPGAAGLDVVAVDGSFGIIDPELGFDLHAATLLAARERAVASGIAAGQQIDDLASDLRAAKGGGYEWVTSPFFLDLTLRKPLAA